MGKLRGRIRSLTRRLGFDVVKAYPPRERWAAESFGVPDDPVLADGRLWVSFSLYGTDRLYVEGIAAACLTYREMFPGWTPIIFVGDSVPRDVITTLARDFHAVIRPQRGAAEDSSAMFWRYLAGDLVRNGAILFRDADSRASRRERAAVDEWLASGTTFHIMRDHPNHVLPIMGGMWGMKIDDEGFNVRQSIADYGPDPEFSGDQRWLESMVYPKVIDSCLVHQDSPLYSDASSVWVRPFPLAAERGTFVGQGVTPDGEPRPGHGSP